MSSPVDENTPDAVSPQNRWNHANPLALWAHNAVRSALRRGIIQRQPCAICGSEPAEAHHPDYTRPLFIEWLCRLHHRRAHRKTRRTECNR